MDHLIRSSNASPTRAVEVVERKGLGHPDTICDSVAEEISRALCKQYRDHFDIVLHHNVELRHPGLQRTETRVGEGAS